MPNITVIQNILIVCTGNICRSPIGEGLFKARNNQLSVASAGTAAMVGWAADAHSIDVMTEIGLDITAHRAQQITRTLLGSADLVLTLDHHHSDWINTRHPQYRGKVHKLLRWRDNADVPDPYRLPRAVFDQAYDLIEKGVDDWIKRL